MIKRIIKQSALWIIIVGSICWAVSFISGNTIPTFITPIEINYGTYTYTMYRFNVGNYLKQIEQNLQIPIGQMFYNTPAMYKPDWNSVDITLFAKIVYNLFIWWLNMLIWWFNTILLVPIKLIAQPVILLCTILGIDLTTNNVISIIYKLYTLLPPIIPYW